MGADRERIARLVREFEEESERVLAIMRDARRNLACASDKLTSGIELELYAERRMRERSR